MLRPQLPEEMAGPPPQLLGCLEALAPGLAPGSKPRTIFPQRQSPSIVCVPAHRQQQWLPQREACWEGGKPPRSAPSPTKLGCVLPRRAKPRCLPKPVHSGESRQELSSTHPSSSPQATLLPGLKTAREVLPPVPPHETAQGLPFVCHGDSAAALSLLLIRPLLRSGEGRAPGTARRGPWLPTGCRRSLRCPGGSMHSVPGRGSFL